jgi:8-oxo-(d)GTP phosphatase
VTLYLVRHAEAGPAPDEERPLTEAGRRRAEAIAAQLAGVDIGRVLSSRYVRCAETVAPLADRLGVALEHHPHLAEEADVDDAWALLEALVTDEVDAVVCSHGNVLGPLLDRVLRRGADVHGEWTCRKGCVWRLDPDGDGRFARATLLP